MVKAVALASVAVCVFAAAGTPAAAAQRHTQAKVPLTWVTSWNHPWSLNPYNSNYVGELNGLVLAPLAIPMFQITRFQPVLATSWHASASQVTVQIRQDAKWQTGQEVTAQDVINTILLDGVTKANDLLDDVSNLTAPNPHEVIVDLRKGSSPALALYTLMQVTPVAPSFYQRFTSAGLKAQVLAAYAPNPSSSATAFVSSLDKRILAYNPGSVDGNGPFRLSKINIIQTLLPKSKTFWDASAIHVQEFAFYNAANTNTVCYDALFGGKADLSGCGMAWPLVKKWLSMPGSHDELVQGYGQRAIYFNMRKYPFSLLAVRRAFAHIMNWRRLVELSHEGHFAGRADSVSDGLSPQQNQQYLTSAERSSLKTYTYDPAKATKLLESVHFRKTSHGWVMPNGRPFNVTIGGPAGYTGPVNAVTIVAHELSAFGIHATARAIEQPGYWTQLNDGQFEVDWGWGGFSSDPLEGFTEPLNSYDYTTPSEPGIGFGPHVNLPGVGRVAVSQTILDEAQTVGPGSEMKKLTWDWAHLVNTELPYLTYSTGGSQWFYSTRRYTHWPAVGSLEWQVVASNYTDGIAFILEKGYVRPVG